MKNLQLTLTKDVLKKDHRSDITKKQSVQIFAICGKNNNAEENKNKLRKNYR